MVMLKKYNRSMNSRKKEMRICLNIVRCILQRYSWYSGVVVIVLYYCTREIIRRVCGFFRMVKLII